MPLYALAAKDWEGNGEPPLAQIVKTLGYDIDVGFTTLASNGNSFPIGDEVLIDLFQKAGSGPVEVVPVARYAPEFPVPFGWYEPTSNGTAPASGDLNVLGTLSEKPSSNSDLGNPHHQMLFPPLQGGSTTFDPVELAFDPGDGTVFGFFSKSPDNTGYTEDAINPPTNSGSLHRVRAYPLKDRGGNPVPNSYLIGFEEAHNHDHNDYVFIVSNVQPAAAEGVLATSDVEVDFGSVAVGAETSYTLTLSNSGSTAINLSGIALSGDAAFSVLTDPLSTVVAAGASEELELAFSPDVSGPYAATLTVNHDGTNAPLTVDLSGTGVEPGEALARINVGGGAYTDIAGNAWDADDAGLITGSTNSEGSDVFDVQGTDDDDLFATRRWGTDFTYDVPVPVGSYDVKLYFAEPYWGRSGTGGANGGAGDRLFDVTLEGALVLDGYDLYADGGGWGVAITKTYTDVAVSDGALTIELDVVPNKDNAIISGIEVLSTSPAAGEMTIAGAVRYSDGAPMAGAELALSPLAGGDAATATAGSSGAYALEAAAGQSYALAARAADLAPGQLSQHVTAGDALRTLRHAVNLAPFEAPSMAALAADADGDGEATAADALWALQAAVGLRSAFEQASDAPAAGYSHWRCVAAGSYAATYAYDPLAADQAGQDFACALRGDADLSWQGGEAAAKAGPALAGGSGTPLRLALEAAPGGGPGGEAVVEVRADGFRSVGAAQFTVEWDAEAFAFAGLDLDGAGPEGLSSAHFNAERAESEGALAFGWFHPAGAGQTLPEGARLFAVRLRPRSAESSSAVEVTGSVASAAAYRVGADGALAASAVEAAAAEVAAVPAEFALRGNYPNPFNPATTVAFDLPEAAKVTLEVFDVAGRRVLRVEAGELQAGSGQRLRVDGSHLASGLYLYRVVARSASGAHAATGRMTLLK